MSEIDPWGTTDTDVGLSPEEKAAQDRIDGGERIPALTVESDKPGDVRGGTIIKPPVMMQATEYGTNRPLFWPVSGQGAPSPDCTGQPKMQIVITVQLDEGFTPRDEDDPGLRRVYLTGGRKRIGTTEQAFFLAKEEAGIKRGQSLVGWRLYDRHEGFKKNEKGKDSRLHKMILLPPGSAPLGQKDREKAKEDVPNF